MFCPNCGTQNPETATSCSSCQAGLKGAGPAKFKGTMLMSTPAATPAPGAPAPAPAAPAPAVPAPAAPAAARPAALKGTMVGVAPPNMAGLMQHAPPAAAPAPAPQAAAPAPFGAPAPTAPFGSPMAPAPQAAAPAPQAAAPAPFGGPAPGPVNPLGGTIALDQMPAMAGFQPPPAQPAPQAPAPQAAPPAQQGWGAPTPPAPAAGAAWSQQGPHGGYGGPAANPPAPAPQYGGQPGFGGQQGPGVQQAWGAPPASRGAAAGGPVGTTRNPVLVLVLSMMCFVYGLVAMIGMVGELKAYTRKDDLAAWKLFIPIYGLIFWLVNVPAAVREAKQMAGCAQTDPKNVVLYWLLGPWALAADLNDVWTAGRGS